MRNTGFGFAARMIAGGGLALALLCAASAQAQTVAAAMADSGRPAEDVARDPVRHPAEVLAFAGLKPGAKVAERYPGNSYYSRLLAKAVAPAGKVYVLMFKRPDGSVLDMDKAQSLPGAYPNVVLVPTVGAVATGVEPLDMVISILNYHDTHNGPDGGEGAALLNKTSLAALKPGGTYLVIDHAAPAGAGASLTAKLHRIEMDTAKAEIVAAGFVFDGSSEIMRNPADPRTAIVSDPSILGRTDQFMLKFHKPN